MADLIGAVAIIPARGGSKRLPRKNLLPLGGRPLIAWTIEAAFAADCFADVVVTSDDEEILAIARGLGTGIHHRRGELATDEASTTDVMLDVLDWLESSGKRHRTCVLLQPTSPLRTGGDIRAALRMYDDAGGDTVISVSELLVPLGWCGTLGVDGRMQGFAALGRAGGVPTTAYRLNGAIYVFDVPRFRRERRYPTERNVGFVIPSERATDIDTENDFRACEAFLQATRAAS